MKSNIVMLFILLVPFDSHGQTQNITGEWKTDWSKTYAAMSTAEKNKFDAIPADPRNKIITSFSTRVYTFSNNGNIYVAWDSNVGPKSESGTWTISGSELTITIRSNPIQFGIAKDGDVMTLSQESVTTNAIVSKLVLAKQ